ncbi:MAG: hypothetical protein ACP5LS_03715 [Thermoprotei archaeon]
MGYSASDLREYRDYLRSRYGTFQNLDRAWNSSFSDIKLPPPLTKYWPYFQQFRMWSINVTYSDIYIIRGLSNKSLFSLLRGLRF